MRTRLLVMQIILFSFNENLLAQDISTFEARLAASCPSGAPHRNVEVPPYVGEKSCAQGYAIGGRCTQSPHRLYIEDANGNFVRCDYPALISFGAYVKKDSNGKIIDRGWQCLWDIEPIDAGVQPYCVTNIE